MKVLVVEDDPAIAGQIARGLAAYACQATVAMSGAAALAARQEDGPFDTIVLDRMLPDMGGLDVLARLRAAGEQAPVLMLSALGSVSDRVEGLRAGVDDYLAKPFDIEELSARLMTICRRAARAPQPADAEMPAGSDLAVGALRLDATRHRVLFGAAGADLNRKQFSLLAALMRHADRPLTRSMLLETVWGYTFDPATNIVESNLSRLRARLVALGCDAIETRRGEGYVLASHKCA